MKPSTDKPPAYDQGFELVDPKSEQTHNIWLAIRPSTTTEKTFRNIILRPSTPFEEFQRKLKQLHDPLLEPQRSYSWAGVSWTSWLYITEADCLYVDEHNWETVKRTLLSENFPKPDMQDINRKKQETWKCPYLVTFFQDLTIRYMPAKTAENLESLQKGYEANEKAMMIQGRWLQAPQPDAGCVVM